MISLSTFVWLFIAILLSSSLSGCCRGTYHITDCALFTVTVITQTSWIPAVNTYHISQRDTFIYTFHTFTARKRSLRRLCFTRVCHSVHRGSGIPACPCKSPGPNPEGRLRGLSRGVSRPSPGGSPGLHAGGELRGLAWGVSRPTPSGVSRPTPRREVCIPACTEADTPHPSRRLLLRVVCILLECILVYSSILFIQPYVFLRNCLFSVCSAICASVSLRNDAQSGQRSVTRNCF